ncbi:hypothetical protein [Actinomadura kijaniata]|uniref:hypothetical protein n=1 Tax=Actinomadura kijaniata TaxID=46161 RepID=UPI000836E497|nr:hypothetical protein [Actinomadura kijaniata]
MICETQGPARLAALLMACRAHHIGADLVGVGDMLRLRVQLTASQELDVRCTVRADDDGRLWYLAVADGRDLPIAEAYDVTGALVTLRGMIANARTSSSTVSAAASSGG